MTNYSNMHIYRKISLGIVESCGHYDRNKECAYNVPFVALIYNFIHIYLFCSQMIHFSQETLKIKNKIL